MSMKNISASKRRSELQITPLFSTEDVPLREMTPKRQLCKTRQKLVKIHQDRKPVCRYLYTKASGSERENKAGHRHLPLLNGQYIRSDYHFTNLLHSTPRGIKCNTTEEESLLFQWEVDETKFTN